MKHLGRDAAELTALADHLTAHGLVLEMLAGPLPGIYDPTGPGRILFGFFAAMAETERENIREATLEGLDAAARKGNHGGGRGGFVSRLWQASIAGQVGARVRQDSRSAPGPWDAWQAERYQRGEISQRLGCTDNPARPR